MKKTIVFLILILIHNTSLTAQQLTQTVRGKVYDSQSESALIGATIILLNADPIKGAVADVNGEFTIKDVPLGRHSFKVTFVGYEESIVSGILVGSGKQPYLNIKLKESFNQIEEVVIVAADKEDGKPLNDLATVSAKSFSVEQTSRYAATFNDPARAALSFAGVATGGDDILNEIVIRGNSPRGLLWRIEGVEVANPNHFADVGSSAGGISMLSNNVLANSDFFTGAFPAEYGNASSGVFDIQLRNGNNQKKEYALQAGFLGIAAAAEGPFSKNGNASYLINYRYSTLALFDDIGLNITGENEDIIFSDLSFKLHFPTKKTGTFAIWGLGGRSTDDFRADPENGDPYNDKIHNQLGIIGLNHVFYPAKNTYIESTLTLSERITEFNGDSLGIKQELVEDFSETTVRISSLINTKFNARNSLRSGLIYSLLGFDLFSREFDDSFNRLVTNVNEKGNTQFLQAYSQWQFRATEKLTLNTGFHYSQLLLNNSSSLEPRFGAKYILTNSQTLTFGLGIHSRMETTSIYLGTVENENGDLFQPNKDLELMKAAHIVLGYGRSFNNWQIKTEAYYQHLYDVPIRSFIDAEAGSPQFQGAFSLLNISEGFVTDSLSNGGTGRNYGLEITAERRLKKGFYTVLTTSIFQSKYTALDGIERNTRYNANYLVNIIAGKEWKVGKNNQNILSLNAKFILSGNNRFIPVDLEESRMEGETFLDFNSIYERSLADYWRVDFGIRYIKNRPKTTSIIALNVQNLTSRENEAGQFFFPQENRIVSETQLALFPNLSYRLEF